MSPGCVTMSKETTVGEALGVLAVVRTSTTT